jgi:transketolase
MAIAERWLAARYNRLGFDIFNYDIFAVCGDGCLMEGVGAEAASLAGHLGLDNLCRFYDNNHITIEGRTGIAFTEDVAAHFVAYGWQVRRVGDANDIALMEGEIAAFRSTKGRPTLIIVDSHIGYGSPNRQDTSAAHSEPFGEEQVRLCKRAYGWPEDARFLVPDGVREHFAAGSGSRGNQAHQRWTVQSFDKLCNLANPPTVDLDDAVADLQVCKRHRASLAYARDDAKRSIAGFDTATDIPEIRRDGHNPVSVPASILGLGALECVATIIGPRSSRRLPVLAMESPGAGASGIAGHRG